MSNNFKIKHGLEVANGITVNAGGLNIVGGGLTLPNELRIGTAAGSDRFPNTVVSISNTSISTKPSELHNIGLIAEGTANSTDTSVYGVGVYGIGYTAGATRSGGVVGEGHVSTAADTGSSIGVRGYALDTHTGGANIGLYGNAANGLTNYALYMSAGDINSVTAQTWSLGGDLTFSGAHTVTIPTLALTNALPVTSGGTGVTTSTGSSSVVLSSNPTLTTPSVNTSLATSSTSFDLINANATAVNFAGAATALSISAGSGTTTINNNLVVGGNITFGGGSTQLSATVLNVEDPLIYMAENNPADILDIGLFAGYTTGGTHKHTGLFRDASDGVWKIFSGITAEPAGNVIDLTGATYDDLKIGKLTTTGVNKVVITEPSSQATLTLDGGSALVTSGAHSITLTSTADSVITLPVSGTLVSSTVSTLSSLSSVGTITTGTWSGSFGSVSGANLTNLTAGNLSGTIPSTVLANSSIYIGSTQIALNRSTGSLALTGITSIDGSAGGLTTATGSVSVSAASAPSAGQALIATSPTAASWSTLSSINKVNITAPAVSATLTLDSGSTLATSGANSITLVSTGPTSVTLPTSGTLVNNTVTSLPNLSTVDTVTTGTWSANFGAVSGANLTNLTAGNLSGTIPSAVLANSSHYIGTTQVALNRASASQTLTGVSIDGAAGSLATTGSPVVVSGAGTPTINQVLTATSGTAAEWRDISAILGSSAGTVTSVSGQGTVNGITLTGAVATSGYLTLGGTLSGIDLTTQVTNILPVANGGSGTSTATGTGSLVLGTSPAITTSLTTPSTSFELVNANATTVNFAGAATTLSIGGSSGNTTVNNNLVVTGNFTVNGTNNIINTSSINVADSIISMASGNTVNSVDIGIYGIHDSSTTTKYTGFVRDASDGNTWKLFDDITTLPTTTVDFTSATYAPLKVGLLTATKLNNVTVTQVATGATLSLANNSTLTTAGNFTTAGAFPLTLTATASTNVTLPTTGTLLSDTSTTFNKVSFVAPATTASISLANNSTLTTAGNFTTSGAYALTLTTTGATSVILPTSGTLVATSTVNTVTGRVQDSDGNLRSIPQSNKTAAYTLVAADNGKNINITTGGITIPTNSIFAAGDVISIYNQSGTAQNISWSGGTVYLGGTSTAKTSPLSLAARGILTILFVTGGATPEIVVSGNV